MGLRAPGATRQPSDPPTWIASASRNRPRRAMSTALLTSVRGSADRHALHPPNPLVWRSSVKTPAPPRLEVGGCHVPPRIRPQGPVTDASDTHRTIRQRIDPGTLGEIPKLGTAPSLTGKGQPTPVAQHARIDRRLAVLPIARWAAQRLSKDANGQRRRRLTTAVILCSGAEEHGRPIARLKTERSPR